MTPDWLRGVVPVLATPFHADESVDGEGFASVADQVLGAGVTTVMFPGYASEMMKLSEDERDALTTTLLETARRRGAHVVVSVSDHATRNAVRRAERAAAAGADAINVLPPFLLAPSAADIAEHLRAVLRAVAPLPVVVQYAPVQTGTVLPPELLGQTAVEHENLVAVKVEATPPGRTVTALLELSPPLAAFVGYAGLHLADALRRGATGVWPGCSFVEVYVELWRLWESADTAGFADLHTRLLPYLTEWMGHIEIVVQVEKTISKERGVIASDVCRRPGYRLERQDRGLVDAFLEEFEPYLRATT